MLGYKLVLGLGVDWAREGTMHLGLVLGWGVRSWASARSKTEVLVGCPPRYSLCSFPPAPLHASRWACGRLRVIHGMGWQS